jgi:RNA polymerase-binding transcription factor DksA
MNTKLLEELKKALEEERTKLIEELRVIAVKDPKLKGDWDARYPQFETGEYGSHSSLETEADEVEEYEARLEAEHSLESRLLAVTHALQRIAEGIYGKCRKCGKDIPPDRLRANPAAEFCQAHTSQNR